MSKLGISYITLHKFIQLKGKEARLQLHLLLKRELNIKSVVCCDLNMTIMTLVRGSPKDGALFSGEEAASGGSAMWS